MVSAGIRRYPQVSGRDSEGFGVLGFFSKTRVFRDPEVSVGIRRYLEVSACIRQVSGGIRQGFGIRRDLGFFFANTCFRDSEGSGG